ncbi:hypothetical protein [Marivivens marinus]|uniref:hypothetical protein n=1 Tax=Marivivens marinus TaxID=3110173 RepID=UPI003B846C7A
MGFKHKVLIGIIAVAACIVVALRFVPIVTSADVAKVDGVPPTVARPLLFDFKVERYLIPRELVWAGWPWTPYFGFYTDPHIETSSSTTKIYGWTLQLVSINPHFGNSSYLLLATYEDAVFLVQHNNLNLRGVMNAELLVVDADPASVLFLRPDEGYNDQGVDIFLLDVSGEDFKLSGGILAELEVDDPVLAKLFHAELSSEAMVAICQDEKAVQRLEPVARQLNLRCD